MNNFNSGAINVSTLSANKQITSIDKSNADLKKLLEQIRLPWLENLFINLNHQQGKKSFLVFRNNKYVNILTENIAMFYIKYDSPVIMCFDRQEYFVNHSLEHIQELIAAKQFFRLNRQYLINFNAVKEVEHYFARKLLVNASVPVKDKLLVSKERVTEFLHWLDDR
jgi:two-component system response regulator LytT